MVNGNSKIAGQSFCCVKDQHPPPPLAHPASLLLIPDATLSSSFGYGCGSVGKSWRIRSLETGTPQGDLRNEIGHRVLRR